MSEIKTKKSKKWIIIIIAILLIFLVVGGLIILAVAGLSVFGYFGYKNGLFDDFSFLSESREHSEDLFFTSYNGELFYYDIEKDKIVTVDEDDFVGSYLGYFGNYYLNDRYFYFVEEWSGISYDGGYYSLEKIVTDGFRGKEYTVSDYINDLYVGKDGEHLIYIDNAYDVRLCKVNDDNSVTEWILIPADTYKQIYMNENYINFVGLKDSGNYTYDAYITFEGDAEYLMDTDVDDVWIPKDFNSESKILYTRYEYDDDNYCFIDDGIYEYSVDGGKRLILDGYCTAYNYYDDNTAFFHVRENYDNKLYYYDGENAKFCMNINGIVAASEKSKVCLVQSSDDNGLYIVDAENNVISSVTASLNPDIGNYYNQRIYLSDDGSQIIFENLYDTSAYCDIYVYDNTSDSDGVYEFSESYSLKAVDIYSIQFGYDNSVVCINYDIDNDTENLYINGKLIQTDICDYEVLVSDYSPNVAYEYYDSVAKVTILKLADENSSKIIDNDVFCPIMLHDGSVVYQKQNDTYTDILYRYKDGTKNVIYNDSYDLFYRDYDDEFDLLGESYEFYYNCDVFRTIYSYVGGYWNINAKYPDNNLDSVAFSYDVYDDFSSAYDNDSDYDFDDIDILLFDDFEEDTYFNENNIITIWCYDTQFANCVKEYALKDNCNIKFRVCRINSENDYYKILNEALKAGGKYSPDIYQIDNDFRYEYFEGEMSQYAISFEEVGIDVDKTLEEGGFAPYVSEMGYNSNGDFLGMGYISEAGLFYYKKDLAKEIWGTDDSGKIAEIIGGGSGDFNKFTEASKEAKEAGYYMLSGTDDLWKAYEGMSDQGFFDDNGNFSVPEEYADYLDYAKMMYNNEYIKDLNVWTDYWFDSISDDTVVGFFGSKEFFDYILAENSQNGYDDWGVCIPPKDFIEGGTLLMLSDKVLENSSKMQIISGVLNSTVFDVSDDGLLNDLTLNIPYYSVLSSEVMKNVTDVLNDGNPSYRDVFIEGNEMTVSGYNRHKDFYVDETWRKYVYGYVVYDDLSKDTVIDTFTTEMITYLYNSTGVI